MQYKILSWNVNGLRAVLKKGFVDTIKAINWDILSIQETKLQIDNIPEDIQNLKYYKYFNFSTIKKGYSGVATFSKIKPLSVETKLNKDIYDLEGRFLQLDFKDFVLFNIYFPNGQSSEERLNYKLNFYEDLFNYINVLKNKGKNIVIVGDFNTAHNEIDLKNPKANSKRSGFLPIERKWLDKIIEMGYIDTYRYLYPDKIEYSWWSYRFNARKKNIGWRIDYIFISENLKDNLVNSFILTDIYGSDHCPVGIELIF